MKPDQSTGVLYGPLIAVSLYGKKGSMKPDQSTGVSPVIVVGLRRIIIVNTRVAKQLFEYSTNNSPLTASYYMSNLKNKNTRTIN